MCERCREHKAILWEEIRLLASREGAEYEAFEVCIDSEPLPDWKDADETSLDPDLVRQEMIDVAVAQAIAVRSAFLAYYCDIHTDEGKIPPSLVLGTWAANCLKIEIEQEQAERELHHFLNRFGMGNN